MRVSLLFVLLAACSPDVDRAIYPPRHPRDAAGPAEEMPDPPPPAQPTCSELLAGPSVPGCPSGPDWRVTSVPCADAGTACHWGCWGTSQHPVDDRSAGQLWNCQVNGIVCVSAPDRCY